MPDVEGGFSAAWGGTGQLGQGIVLPWGTAAAVENVGTAYTAPAPPGGGTEFTPGDLVAAATIGPADVYRQAHTASVVDMRTGNPLPVARVSIDLQDGSDLWSFSATSAPDAGGSLFRLLTDRTEPPAVQITIDGRVWCFLVESVTRPRADSGRTVSFGGRSLAAIADSPFQLQATYSADAPTTAAQLAASALLAAGVELDWQMVDWVIPENAVSLSATPMGVVRALAAAAGAVVEAHPSEARVSVRSRYEALPNEWAYLQPDVQIHGAAIVTDNYEIADKPAYTGIFVAGQQSGGLTYVKLEGTSGADQAPMVSDALLTEEAARVERARAELGVGGQQARVTATLPVLTGAGQPGVLQRGQLLRVVDPEGGSVEIWHGMVRSVSVALSMPGEGADGFSLRQTVSVERHTKHIVDPETAEPLLFVGAIGDQTGELEAEFSLDLTPYRSGGAPPYTWSVRSGTLPSGLAISGESIVGTPLVVQEALPMRLRVTDSVSQMQDSAEFDFTVLTGSRLLTLTFEDTYACQATGIAFTPTGSVSFDADGKFGKGVKINGAASSSSRLNSAASSELWDLMGTADDWCICGWFRADELLLSQEKRMLQVWAPGLNSNQNVTVTVFSVTSNTQLRVRIYHPFAELFLTNAQVLIPYDNEPHFVAAGRVGNTLYCSVDGSARSGLNGGTAGGTSWTTAASYRSTPGARNIVIGNNTVNTGAFRGMLDSLQIIRGYPFDVVNGFTVPTTPVV